MNRRVLTRPPRSPSPPPSFRLGALEYQREHRSLAEKKRLETRWGVSPPPRLFPSGAGAEARCQRVGGSGAAQLVCVHSCQQDARASEGGAQTKWANE